MTPYALGTIVHGTLSGRFRMSCIGPIIGIQGLGTPTIWYYVADAGLAHFPFRHQEIRPLNDDELVRYYTAFLDQ